jgi:transcriptional regulator with XRE-family HTH domain
MSVLESEMDPLKNFSANLKRECSRFNSIAEICRGANINRQQFNKYLAGDHLPNPRTRKRLCEFLGVEEDQMFLAPASMSAAQPGVGRTRLSSKELTAQAIAIANLLQSFGYDVSGGSVTNNEGYYGCYFPLQGIPGMVVRTIIKVKKHDTISFFVRHTSFSSIRFPNRRLAKNRHMGLVVSKDGLTYFIGIKTEEPNHFSYLAFDSKDKFGKDVFVGLGMTQGSDGPMASRICLEYCGREFSAGKALARSLGVMKSTDSTVPFVANLVFQPTAESSNAQLVLPRVEETGLLAAMMSIQGGLSRETPAKSTA